MSVGRHIITLGHLVHFEWEDLIDKNKSVEFWQHRMLNILYFGIDM